MIAVFLQCALPFAVALFPQHVRVASSQLEPEFRDLKDAQSGLPLTSFVFNKGV